MQFTRHKQLPTAIDNTHHGQTYGRRDRNINKVMDPKSHPIRDIAAPGIKAQPPLLRMLKEEVASLLGRNSINFPGAQPVSFARHHLEELMRDE